jgi:phosphoribosylglycinamide formyltransferase 2
MLLGAGELGKEVIIALQRHQVAHRAHVIDMTDGAALAALIEREQPHLVVPEIEAIATAALVELEKAGKASVIPTARAAWLTMNREGIRRLVAEQLDLPTSPYRFADSLAQLKTACADIGFPCVIKPVMSSSGKGQSKIDGPDEVAAAWDYAASGSRVDAGRVIVEGFIDFDYEITLLTVRALDRDGQPATHFCEPIGHLQVRGDYVESWQPHPMSASALARAKEIARKVTDDLGGRGVFGVELFVMGDMVWFSEVSPRPHDTGMVTLASQVQSEFELHAKAILGFPVDTALATPGASAVIYGQHEARAIAFDGVADALGIPGVDIRLFGKPESFARRRMGVALARAADVDSARKAAREAAGRVKPVVAAP